SQSSAPPSLWATVREMLAAARASLGEVGPILLCKHEPDASGCSPMIASLSLQWFHVRSQPSPGRTFESSQTSNFRRGSRHTTRSAKNSQRRSSSVTFREVISGLYARIRSAKKAPPSSERWPSTRIEPNPPYGDRGAASSFLQSAVVAISEIGVCQNVEGSFDVGKVSGSRVAYKEFERTHPPSEAELIERCR